MTINGNNPGIHNNLNLMKLTVSMFYAGVMVNNFIIGHFAKCEQVVWKFRVVSLLCTLLTLEDTLKTKQNKTPKYKKQQKKKTKQKHTHTHTLPHTHPTPHPHTINFLYTENLIQFNGLRKTRRYQTSVLRCYRHRAPIGGIRAIRWILINSP